MKLERGLVHIYTGDGKGKTTAALGVALRALGWGIKVTMVQFIKGYQNLGEIKFAEQYPKNFSIKQFSLDLARDIDGAKVVSRQQEAQHAFEYAVEAVMSSDFDLVILDELAVAVNYGLIDVESVVKLIKNKPVNVELVITGRGALKELVDAADYVTEMHLVKHPYENGIQARPAIDY